MIYIPICLLMPAARGLQIINVDWESEVPLQCSPRARCQTHALQSTITNSNALHRVVVCFVIRSSHYNPHVNRTGTLSCAIHMRCGAIWAQSFWTGSNRIAPKVQTPFFRMRIARSFCTRQSPQQITNTVQLPCGVENMQRSHMCEPRLKGKKYLPLLWCIGQPIQINRLPYQHNTH